MCGRYTLKTPSKNLADLFGTLAFPDLAPRFNLGPGQKLLCVRSASSSREAAFLKWGLLPRFIADPTKSPKPINARAETVATNGFYKHAFTHRRCLVPADGFFEPEESGGEKTGRWWHFKFEDDRPFAFGGLWETWGEGDSILETFTIITTEPMEKIAECGHQRSPLILSPEQHDVWLDPDAKVPLLKRLLVPHSSEGVVGYPVNGRAKNTRNEGPDLIEPVQ